MKVFAAVVTSLVPAIAQAQPAQTWSMHDGWYWWMPFHGVLSLLMVGVVVGGSIFLIRFLWQGSASSGATPSQSAAIDQLDGRYARGDIDRDEYLQRKRDLTGG